MARKNPAIIALVAVVSGIVFADTFEIASWIFLLAALSLLPLLVFYHTSRKFLAAGAAGLGVLLLFSAYNYTFRMKTFPPGHVIHYAEIDKICTIYGEVDDWPVISENRTGIFVAVDSIECEGRRERSLGRLLLRINTETTVINYGDRIFFNAVIYPVRDGKNPVGFDYKRYLNLRSVFGTCYLPNQYTIQIDPAGQGDVFTLIDRMRRFILETFRESLGRDASAMSAGFLIGYTRDISTEVYGYFRDSGTLHLLAVSGSNVGLVAVLFVFLLRASSMKLPARTLLLLLIIIVFSFLAYNQPSVVRASVMASLVLIGRALQRRVDLNNIIASAALIILLFKPGDLFDIGFQLSFVTAWGLIFFVPRLTVPFKDYKTRWYYKYMIFPLIVCITAQLVSLPMCAFYFQRLPMISFLSNLVIVPLVSVIVIAEIILILAYLLLPYAGLMVGALLDPLIRFTLMLLRFFGTGDVGFVFKYNLPGAMLILYYMFLLVFVSALFSRLYRRMIVLLVLLTANVILVMGLIGNDKSPRLDIFSVPGGIAAVSQIGPAHLILSDLAVKDYLIAEKMIAPFLDSRSIKPDKIFILSADYHSLKEAYSLMNKYDSLSAFAPASARGSMNDIIGPGRTPFDSGRIIYYDEAAYPIGRENYESAVRGRSMIYRFDSSSIIFAGNHSDPDWLAGVIDEGGDLWVVVKARVDVEDLNRLSVVTSGKIQLIICNRLTPKARQFVKERMHICSDFPELIETSQVGAVELVVVNGRVEIRNKKIRIIDG
ncbi:MAG: hypothetical protein CVT49_01500 [candidate division Zixibacteria bacterium HGW-Zixibacteria-1]|nr:MAG: hypothetical protein CVT49_01500 [candidate division Zixibacteria bacterium HGW-Zixibacteria-1]